MEKKEYKAPKMNVIEMKSQAVLLGGSDEGAPTDTFELENEEFGYNGNSISGHHA